jgi:phage/plasmid-like protein (TIGR03299 family)
MDAKAIRDNTMIEASGRSDAFSEGPQERTYRHMALADWDKSEVIADRQGRQIVNREHGLALREDGTARMIYVGDPPWHGMGTKLDKPATSAEAIVTAGLEDDVELVDLVAEDDGTKVDHRLCRNARTKVHYGVVGASYRPIQNRECFAFLDSLAADRSIEYHTAGAINDGQRIWLLAKLPGVLRVGDSDDTIDKYLLLMNAHDGRGAGRCLFTPDRVVCRNTLAIALANGGEAGITIRHKGNIMNKVAEAQRVLGLAIRFYDDLSPIIDGMAAHKPSARQVKNYFETLYPDPEDEEKERAAENARAIRGVLHDLFETGAGNDMPKVKGSTWAMYNAVTEYTDHIYTPGKMTDVGKSKRLESMWYGPISRLKREAYSMATELAGVN